MPLFDFDDNFILLMQRRENGFHHTASFELIRFGPLKYEIFHENKHEKLKLKLAETEVRYRYTIYM